MGFTLCRHEYHRDIPGLLILLQTLAGLKTVDARHLDVEQDEIRHGILGDFEGALAVGGYEDAVTFGLQGLTQNPEVFRSVVDDEDLGAGQHDVVRVHDDFTP